MSTVEPVLQMAAESGAVRATRLGGVRSALRDRRIACAAAMLVLALLVAALGPLLVPHAPDAVGVGEPLESFSGAHWLGTDPLGRDELSRIVAGARISIAVAVAVAVAAITLGVPLGMLIGYRGGAADFVVGRVFDFMFAFPALLLALTLAAVLGPGLGTVTIALVVIYIPITARFVRGLVLGERDRDYVLSARIVGASHARILARHILPNIASPLLVLVSSIMAFSILAEAALSYLGVGAQPPTASWGKMLTESQSYLSTAPRLALAPGLAITYIVLALNLLGDGLRDHLDPRFERAIQR